MGSACAKPQIDKVDKAEKAKDLEITKKIDQEARKDEKVFKLLLLGAGESGKSTIFKQIKVLFQKGFDESERKDYTSVIHANVHQSICTLFLGCKEFSETEVDQSSKYVLQPENQAFCDTLPEKSDEFQLNVEIASKIQMFWKDPAIQATYLKANQLQLPDCTHHLMENVMRIAAPDYLPTQEDVLYARQQTTGVVETEFCPKAEMKYEYGKYRLFDVGGQRSERRKWIHLFDGVTAVIFCAALSEYDQVLSEDENKNRMEETKELFDWILKQPWFKNTSFLLFLNKFDLFEQKAAKVPLTICSWFKDYNPSADPTKESDYAYEYIKKKFEELYKQNTPTDNVKRVFRIYKTTAIDKRIVEETFKLVDETLTRQRLIDAGLL